MSTSQEYIEYISDLLSPLGAIEIKRMFGGALLKVEDRQLGVILEDTLYFKVVDPELQDKYRRLGSKQFSYTRRDKDQPVIIKNWWQAPEEALDNEAELVALGEEVLAQAY